MLAENGQYTLCMENQRTDIRHTVFYYLPVLEVPDGAEIGRLGDISHCGMLLLTERRITVGKRMRLKVCLPKLAGFEQSELEIVVKTRWLQPDRNPDILCVGCSFIETPASQQDVLERLIHYFTFSDGQRKLSIGQ